MAWFQPVTHHGWHGEAGEQANEAADRGDTAGAVRVLGKRGPFDLGAGAGDPKQRPERGTLGAEIDG